jgi:hypothetical protein
VLDSMGPTVYTGVWGPRERSAAPLHPKMLVVVPESGVLPFPFSGGFSPPPVCLGLVSHELIPPGIIQPGSTSVLVIIMLLTFLQLWAFTYIISSDPPTAL